MAQVQTRATTRALRCAAALALATWLSGCILTTDTLPTGAVVDVPPKYREAPAKPRAALPKVVVNAPAAKKKAAPAARKTAASKPAAKKKA